MSQSTNYDVLCMAGRTRLKLRNGETAVLHRVDNMPSIDGEGASGLEIDRNVDWAMEDNYRHNLEQAFKEAQYNRWMQYGW